MFRILIVEDDAGIREILKKYLVAEGFEIEEAGTLYEMREKISQKSFDVVLLDIMLPDGYATSEIPEFRVEFPETGIIIISARDTDMDRIFGIELGADDYIVKPFNPREVVARVKAFIRRTRGESEVIRFRELEIYCDEYLVKLNGKKVDLTGKEFEILRLLAKNSNRVFSRDEILDKIWKDEFISDRVVDVHISSLRNKIGKDWIITVRGIGYKFSTKGTIK
ncbi:response regulator transcription factor [Thermosipho ferrireducens]|uniref:Response regulator transcription factor n=1 Tax=Thermosipho ferrireducens TaxID=2571116 RepID=A0ABX7S9B4_9BACT|nr:response regulator transcription factor [Thermosipho ferrireducens]QTA37785.1 response regulator transcription factor [Thermosipho ferrireducens]